MKNKINFSKILNNFLLFWTIRAIVLMVLLSGCKKEFLEDMLPHNGGTVTLVARLNVDPQDTIVPAGTSVPIYVEGTNINGSIHVSPDNLIGFTGLNGTYSTPILNGTTVYTFTATGKDGKIYTKSVTVTVVEPVDPKISALCYDLNNSIGFQLNLFEEKDNNGVYQNSNSLFIDQSIFSEVRHYYSSGSYENYLNGQVVGNGNWNFFDIDSISIGGTHFKITELNSTRIVMTTTLYGVNVPNIYARFTYLAVSK